MKPIPYGKHFINRDDISKVSKALNAKYITKGIYNKNFSISLKNFFKCDFLQLCSSGTSGLHLAFLSIGLKKNDNVIMPAINFIASYSMAKQLGANIYLADVNPETGQMTDKNILECIKKNKLKKIKCFISMYLGGSPERNIELFKLKKKLKCFMIEDACHALGSSYTYLGKNFKIGSNKHSDISVFSFHPVKTIATGEGGCVTTNSEKIFNKLRSFCDHGINRNNDKHWDYNIKDLGYNYRLSDLNCALGLSQLNKLKKFLKYRFKIREKYKKLLNDKKISFLRISDHNYSANHLMIIFVNFNIIKSNKDKFMSFMKNNGIFCQQHYKPIYRFNFYNLKKNEIKNFSGSEIYYSSSVSIPIFYGMKPNVQIKIIKKIKYFIKNSKNL